MRWALLLFLTSLSAAAADIPARSPAEACGYWFASFAHAGKDFILNAPRRGKALALEGGRAAKQTAVDAARATRDSVLELRENVRQEGPLRILVRRRSETEKAAGFRDYFILPPDEPAQARYLVTKALARVRRLNPLRRVRIAGGTVDSLDRILLRDYTATNGIRGTAAFAGGLGTAIVLTDYLYEQPMQYLEATVPFRRAVREGLENEYAFAGLRKKLTAGEITREQAEEKVAAEFRGRAKYFDFVRLSLAARKAESMGDIAGDFLPVLNAKELGDTMKDLRFYLSDDFKKNPSFVRKGGADEITAEKFRELFALNHNRLYGTYSLPQWLAPGFDAKSLGEGSAARAIYDELTLDPFRKKLIEYQRQHPDQVSVAKLTAWLSEDLAWATRLASLEILGTGIRAAKGSDEMITMGDQRAEFLEKNNLPR